MDVISKVVEVLLIGLSSLCVFFVKKLIDKVESLDHAVSQSIVPTRLQIQSLESKVSGIEKEISIVHDIKAKLAVLEYVLNKIDHNNNKES